MTGQRPAGVVVAAVVLGLMAAMGIFGSLISAATTFFLRAPGMPEVPGVRAVMVVMAVAILCFFLFCGWTVVGFFRMRAWARYAILAIGGIEFCFCALIGASMVLLRSMPLPVPAGTPSPMNMGIVFLAMAGFYGLMSLIGAWWLVYFNLKPVREAFSGAAMAARDLAMVPGFAPAPGEAEAVMAAAPAQPGTSGWRIVIIVWACLMLFSLLFFPMVFMTHLPLFIFGMELRGVAATTTTVVLLAVMVYIAVGLLKKWTAAWYVALAWQAYTLVFFLTFFVPGVWARFISYQQEIQGYWLSRMNLPSAPPAMDIRPVMAMGMVLGGAMVAVLTWALVERRGDYLHAG